MTLANDQRWLVALDVDGTLLTDRGAIDPIVVESVKAASSRGHEVMIATGRSIIDTIPVLRDLDIWPEYVVTSNGAVILKRDPLADSGYSKHRIETFKPRAVLEMVKTHLPVGRYAVEDEFGDYYFTEAFPGIDHSVLAHKVEFEKLLDLQATRVVVVSPDHEMENFFKVVEQVGLQRVSYSVGWTAWLDISPEGVNKSTALEQVREWLEFPLSRVLAVGDGNNDMEMLEWAARLGRGIAMGNATEDVKAYANEVTADIADHGVAVALSQLP